MVIFLSDCKVTAETPTADLAKKCCAVCVLFYVLIFKYVCVCACDHRFYLPRKFSRCSVDEYTQFLLQGGGSCLFNKPNKVSTM